MVYFNIISVFTAHCMKLVGFIGLKYFIDNNRFTLTKLRT